MVGSISLSLQQVFADDGSLLSGGHVYFIQAGTVATPQNAFQDAGLTLPWANPYVLLTPARLPLVYFADGYIKVRITDADGAQVFNQDNIPVTGFSSGGGGGGTIDPTTVMQTGQLIPWYSTGVVTGFVRGNGRTLGNGSSGATERANADTAALYAFLYNADPNLVVSSGRGANAAADYAANKTIALPDFRGRALAFMDDMGNSAAGRLTATYFGTAATVLGAAGGAESKVVVTANLPPYTPAGTIVSTPNVGTVLIPGGPQAPVGGTLGNSSALSIISTFTGTAQGGTSTPVAVASPMMLATIYVKL
jgi:hypothetical protein